MPSPWNEKNEKNEKLYATATGNAPGPPSLECGAEFAPSDQTLFVTGKMMVP